MTEHTTKFSSDETVMLGDPVFQLHELLYSRTDARGVILSGNVVFKRVAGFDWDELLGAPHKTVRHPDMPKGVFYLVWQRLKAGLPTGAFVKNQRKNGQAYWTFAVIFPSKGGYVSTRLLPTSQMLDTVTSCYAKLRKQETEGQVTPEESAEALMAHLLELGFPNYEAFQSSALATELQSRNSKMGRQTGLLQKRFLDMSSALERVTVETTEMTEAFKAIRTVPLNMRLIASRLENAGGPISAISVNYSQMLEEMSTWVSTFVDGKDCVLGRIRNAIMNGQFVSFSMMVENEMVDAFMVRKDDLPTSVNPDQEVDRMKRHQDEMRELTTDCLQRVENEAKRFARSVLDMKRYVTGLSSTRMMCKIESAALSNSGTALAGIVEQLDECQNEIEDRLARIVELNSIIQGNTSTLRSLV